MEYIFITSLSDRWHKTRPGHKGLCALINAEWLWDPMDPCQDHELQGWDVFSEQGYLDVYTSFSDSSEDQRNLEQGSVEMKNEEPAGAPAGLSPLNMCSPELRQQPITNKTCTVQWCWNQDTE